MDIRCMGKLKFSKMVNLDTKEVLNNVVKPISYLRSKNNNNNILLCQLRTNHSFYLSPEYFRVKQ